MTGKMTSQGFRRPRLVLVLIGALVAAWSYWTGHKIGLQTERADLIAAIWRHVGYGVVLAPLLLVYLLLRVRMYIRSRAQGPAKYLFWNLVAASLFLIVTGPIVVWTYGSDLKVFDWFVIPTPWERVPSIHDPLELAHKYVALAFPWLFLAESAVFMFGRERSSSQ